MDDSARPTAYRSYFVIARVASRAAAIQAVAAAELDCFAPLAMTADHCSGSGFGPPVW